MPEPVPIDIEVVEGPVHLINKTGKLILRDEIDGHDYANHRANFGRREFQEMFGQFEGLEKISRNHIVVFDSSRFMEEDVFENRLEVIDHSTNGTTFPLGNECAEVLAILADVVTIKLSWPLSYEHPNNPSHSQWARYESREPSD